MSSSTVQSKTAPVPVFGRSYRIESLDTLRGLLMVLMALDHTRDYFSNVAIDPTDPGASWPALFITRWLTHLCAPGFIMLAGSSVYLQRQRKSAGDVTQGLLLRGLWLIFLEFTIISFGWSFGIGMPILQVIWVIGASMILLAGLQWLPVPAVAAFAAALIFGHDLLDGIHGASLGNWNDLWLILHERGLLTYRQRPVILYGYPLIPWAGVMALGYCFGVVVARKAESRQRLSILLGAGSLALFAALRLMHGYGDPGPGWQHFPDATRSAMSFFSVQKYPPSLHYLLATLGVVLLLLAFFDRLSGTSYLAALRRVLAVFGRVPFFFYIVHIFLIHGLALAVARAISPNWRFWITPDVVFMDHLAGWGFDLPVIYLIWASVILLLYPLCVWFCRVKDRNRSWWLAYL